jgi:hypothetical protein
MSLSCPETLRGDCPIIADTGGLLRALARTSDGQPNFPEYEAALSAASLVVVPGLVLAEVDVDQVESANAGKQLRVLWRDRPPKLYPRRR